MKYSAFAALCAALLVLASCGKKPAPPPAATPPPPAATVPAPAPVEPAGVTVAAITLGNAIGADKKVTTSLDRLGRNDTIYAAVDTTGTGSATLKARWTYVQGGQNVPVNEEALPINATGPSTTEFHISKPDGWPAGEYLVEVFVDDAPAAQRRFTVN